MCPAFPFEGRLSTLSPFFGFYVTKYDRRCDFPHNNDDVLEGRFRSGSWSSGVAFARVPTNENCRLTRIATPTRAVCANLFSTRLADIVSPCDGCEDSLGYEVFLSVCCRMVDEKGNRNSNWQHCILVFRVARDRMTYYRPCH